MHKQTNQKYLPLVKVWKMTSTCIWIHHLRVLWFKAAGRTVLFWKLELSRCINITEDYCQHRQIKSPVMSLAFPWVPDLMQIIIDRYCKTPGAIFNFFFLESSRRHWLKMALIAISNKSHLQAYSLLLFKTAYRQV